MLTLYGLKSCDTCRKVAKALKDTGHEVTFHDVREVTLTEDILAKYLELFGDALVNTRSTTWRGLGADDRAKPALSLLRENPTLMKRPVIDGDSGVTLGWTKDVQSRYLG